MLITLSFLVLLVGLLMYALSANPKINSIGFEMFRIGLLAFLLCFCMGGGKELITLFAR